MFPSHQIYTKVLKKLSMTTTYILYDIYIDDFFFHHFNTGLTQQLQRNWETLC